MKTPTLAQEGIKRGVAISLFERTYQSDKALEVTFTVCAGQPFDY